MFWFTKQIKLVFSETDNLITFSTELDQGSLNDSAFCLVKMHRSKKKNSTSGLIMTMPATGEMWFCAVLDARVKRLMRCPDSKSCNRTMTAFLQVSRTRVCLSEKLIWHLEIISVWWPMSDVDLMPWVCDDLSCLGLDNGPCHVGNTHSCQIIDVKQCQARLVLR